MISTLKFDLIVEKISLPEFNDYTTLQMILNLKDQKYVSNAAAFQKQTKCVQFEHYFKLEESIQCDENDDENTEGKIKEQEATITLQYFVSKEVVTKYYIDLKQIACLKRGQQNTQSLSLVIPSSRPCENSILKAYVIAKFINDQTPVALPKVIAPKTEVRPYIDSTQVSMLKKYIDEKFKELIARQDKQNDLVWKEIDNIKKQKNEDKEVLVKNLEEKIVEKQKEMEELKPVIPFVDNVVLRASQPQEELESQSEVDDTCSNSDNEEEPAPPVVEEPIHDGPRCKDGSLDMRFKVNRGHDKYGPGYNGYKKAQPGFRICDGRPRCVDGSLDMRFKVNRGSYKFDEIYQSFHKGFEASVSFAAY